MATALIVLAYWSDVVANSHRIASLVTVNRKKKTMYDHKVTNNIITIHTFLVSIEQGTPNCFASVST